MEYCSMRTAPAIIFFLLIASEMGTTAVLGQASVCSSPSGNYHGSCFRDINCANVCSSENKPHGSCHGFKCICSWPCDISERTCETPSGLYKGRCSTDNNCANVCLAEGNGFTGGRCHRGIPRRCFCSKHC